MGAKKEPNDLLVERVDALVRATQDLFILQGLLAGVNVDDIRKILKIDKHRVSNISKHLKDAKSRG